MKRSDIAAIAYRAEFSSPSCTYNIGGLPLCILLRNHNTQCTGLSTQQLPYGENYRAQATRGMSNLK